jgi:hypothetical protein
VAFCVKSGSADLAGFGVEHLFQRHGETLQRGRAPI